MKNSLFDVSINEKDGTITSLVCEKDSHAMNWCSNIVGWGNIRFFDDKPIEGPQIQLQMIPGTQWMSPINISVGDSRSISIYEYADIRVTVERSFDKDGYLNERYTLKNLRDADLFLYRKFRF